MFATHFIRESVHYYLCVISLQLMLCQISAMEFVASSKRVWVEVIIMAFFLCRFASTGFRRLFHTSVGLSDHGYSF